MRRSDSRAQDFNLCVIGEHSEHISILGSIFNVYVWPGFVITKKEGMCPTVGRSGGFLVCIITKKEGMCPPAGRSGGFLVRIITKKAGACPPAGRSGGFLARSINLASKSQIESTSVTIGDTLLNQSSGNLQSPLF